MTNDGTTTSVPDTYDSDRDSRQYRAHAVARKEDLGQLLRSVRGTALARTSALLDTLFEKVDDAFFDMAEKAGNNSTQASYFDSMRIVRLKRQSVEQVFREHLAGVFAEFATATPQVANPDGLGQDAGAGLALLEDRDLDESLAIANTIAKSENRLARQLHALNLRLSLIRGGTLIENATNPIAPAHLCQAFRRAMCGLDLSATSRLVVFKLFDRYVVCNLDALYDEINAQLIQAGVLPNIHDAASAGARRAETLAPVRHMDGASGYLAGSMIESGAARRGAATDESQDMLYETVRWLLARRRSPLPAPEAASLFQHESCAASIAPAELLSALSLLQNQSPVASTNALSLADASQVARQIKHELLDHIVVAPGRKSAHLAGADEDTIDLVAMLFEFILQDRNLPPQMQALLGRLQIPFLKVAFLDRHLFAQKSHPARRLLDSLSQASMGWSEESDRDHRLHDKVTQTVEALLHGFHDDLQVFERSRLDFEAFLQASDRRAEVVEQRATEATCGREKLYAARQTSALEIARRAAGKELPGIVLAVLTGPWTKYLVLMLLRHGAESRQWRQALRFADELVRSAEAWTSDIARMRVKRMLPALERGLRNGLALVAYPESDIRHLLRELSASCSNLIEGIAPEGRWSALAPEGVREGAPGAPVTLDVGHAPEHAPPDVYERVEASVSGVTRADDDQCVLRARGMRIGTRVEFTDAQSGAKERAKLSWISPISERYLFVNRRGLKVSDKPLLALAAEIRCGNVLVLEEVPLFDRALEAIAARLQVRPPSASGIPSEQVA